jgi:hypothetical protein
MPSSLWFELRDAGCFSNQSFARSEREAYLEHRNYVEARNGCHDIKGNTLSSDNSKDDKEEKDN